MAPYIKTGIYAQNEKKNKLVSAARLRLNNNLVISGKAVKVRKSESNLKNHPLLEQPLSRDKCHDLANFYLGFNGWSTEVVYSRVEEIKENPNRCDAKSIYSCLLSEPLKKIEVLRVPFNDQLVFRNWTADGCCARLAIFEKPSTLNKVTSRISATRNSVKSHISGIKGCHQSLLFTNSEISNQGNKNSSFFRHFTA